MPYKEPSRRLESAIKSDFIKYLKRWYPTAHAVIIPATHWRLLPYDCYIVYQGIIRAIELKIDENPVMAHQYHALFEVVQNRGYAFVVRWLNQSRKFVVDNFTLGTAEIFSAGPSVRQLIGDSVLDPDDHPHFKEPAFRKTIDYIMGFSVSPLESEIQEIIKKNWDQILRAKLGRTK